MKRKIVIAVVALVFGLASFSYAKYVKGYKVVEIMDKEVTIQKGEESPVMVTVRKASKYKIGDKVKYNADRLKIRKATPKNDYKGGC